MPLKIKRRSCYFCEETQGVNAATFTPDESTSRSTYNFVSRDLSTCNHVFLRTDSLRKGLHPPYDKVVDRTEKVFRILRHGKEVSVSIDRLKLAYIPKEPEEFPVDVNLKEKVFLQPEEIQESKQKKPRESSSRQETTTRSGRIIRFNSKYS
ncbi:retrovirus-related Pol polyprotein from transposon 412 [Trichonephila clavipes]|nr:retrovirus-related Pol polyprotein from transposon 412 [Trichonephila clavipes]